MPFMVPMGIFTGALLFPHLTAHYHLEHGNASSLRVCKEGKIVL